MSHWWENEYEETGKITSCTVCHGNGFKKSYGSSVAVECRNCGGTGNIPIVREKSR